jgi:hypothetical protein
MQSKSSTSGVKLEVAGSVEELAISYDSSPSSVICITSKSTYYYLVLATDTKPFLAQALDALNS